MTTSPLTVRIGNVELGPGRPRVCVPLTGSTLHALQAEAEAISSATADLVELRIDRFADVRSPRAVEEAVDLLAAVLDSALPVLLTFRTVAEGGGADLGPDVYRELLIAATGWSGVDAIDVEMMLPRDVVGPVIEAAHAAGKPVVMSFHDLTGTPPRDVLVAHLIHQQALGADLVKIATTPASPADVLTLLAATSEYAARPDAGPAITMAMGPLGVVSRLAGETFGSVLTFGTVGAASAPGQLDATSLRAALDLIHDAQER